MTKCVDCGYTISKMAAHCPKCGRMGQGQADLSLFGGLVGFALFVWLLWHFSNN